MSLFHKTSSGQVILGDSLEYLAGLKPASVDLIVTSPPFGLVRKKDYGNVESHEYVDWFKPFGREFKRILKTIGLTRGRQWQGAGNQNELDCNTTFELQ